MTLPRVSVIIPTRDRPKNLADLLLTIINQTYPPLEVIIVDGSPVGSAKHVVYSLSPRFKSINCKLRYVKGSGDGLPAARNLGIKYAEGDAILFLDDDTLLDKNVVGALTSFLKDNPRVIGVQPLILPSTINAINNGLMSKLENAIHKVLMLNYKAENVQKVRRSGMNVFPNNLTRVISVQRLSGCCCCYRREIFDELSFDTNLKRWGFREDLDFSFRVYKKNPGSLYAIPYAKIIHKASEEARLPVKQRVYMTTIYWFYVFFKDVLEGSVLNLMAFLVALLGNLVCNVGWLVIKSKPKCELWGLIYLFGSYATAFRNLRNILMQRLEFFNKNLNR